MSTKLRILSASDVRCCSSMQQAIEAMRTAFAKLSTGAARVPVRTNLPVTEKVQALVMPVSIDSCATFGLKAVSIVGDNPARGLPTIQGVVLLFDASTGVPRALLDGEYLTALRTGAASGLATDLLARPDARHLVVFGTGKQAATQVEGVVAVRPIERVTVVSRDASRAQAFCDQLREVGKFDVTYTTNSAVVREADIICTATPSQQPLFAAGDLPARCHVNAIGSFRRDMCELDPQLLATMSLFVDQRAASLAEAGEIIAAIEGGIIHAEDLTELGELMTRGSSTELKPRTLFKSVGNAVQDLVVADLVLSAAERLGLGEVVGM